MAPSVDQRLLGYLLAATDEAEREAIEADLQRDPLLRERLARLRARLGPLRDAWTEYDPPDGLARRTCAYVAACAAHSETDVQPAAAPVVYGEPFRAALPAGDSAAATWGWPDFSVAAGVLVAALVLIFPAIESSRFTAQVVTCQDHLRQLGQALIGYSRHHQGYFPQLPERGRLAAAGLYAPILLRDGYLDDKRWILCPGSSLAGDPQFRIPSLEELQSAAGSELARLRAMMGGSFGYSLGYTDRGAYRNTRNLGRAMFALMADAPSQALPGYQSLNHGGRGQNVLFEDGHVRFLVTPRPSLPGDDFFVNDLGLIAPGNHCNDAVIGASDAAPVVLVNSGGL